MNLRYPRSILFVHTVGAQVLPCVHKYVRLYLQVFHKENPLFAPEEHPVCSRNQEFKFSGSVGAS